MSGSRKREVSVFFIVGVVLLAGMGGGVAATSLYVFTDERAVSFGEISHENSALQVSDYSYEGPGKTVDSVSVTIENTNDEGTIDATVEVALLEENDGELEKVTSGVVEDSFAAGETTVTVDVEQTREHEFVQTDIVIEEK